MRWTPSILSPLGLLVAARPALSQQQAQAPLAVGPLDLRLVTFNIRYDTSARESGEKPWWDMFCSSRTSRCRMPHVVDHLQHLISGTPPGAVTVISLQEALSNQVTDVVLNLGDTWEYIGDGRDGGSHGEHCPILYDSSAVDVVYEQTRWLSDTPEKVSKLSSARQPGVITIGVFRDRATGEKFIHANTHLDAWDPHTRAAQVQVALDQISRVQISHGPLPLTLSGDFNTVPGEDAFLALLDSGYMRELWDVAGDDRRAGPHDATYTTFKPGAAEQRIDFIWLGVDGGSPWDVRRYEIMDNVRGGVYISDHRAVVGDLRLVLDP